MPADGQGLHLAGALAQRPASARWPKPAAFFAEASAAFTAALRASTSSRADTSSRRKVSPRCRSCSSASSARRPKPEQFAKLFQLHPAHSVRAVTRAVKVSTSPRCRLPADGRELHLAGALAQRPASARWRDARAFFAEPSAALAVALRASTSSRAPMRDHGEGHRLAGALVPAPASAPSARWRMKA